MNSYEITRGLVLLTNQNETPPTNSSSHWLNGKTKKMLGSQISIILVQACVLYKDRLPFPVRRYPYPYRLIDIVAQDISREDESIFQCTQICENLFHTTSNQIIWMKPVEK